MATLRSRDLRLDASSIQDGVVRIEVSSRLSRWQGFMVTCYLVDDILVDTGFPKVGQLMVRCLSNRKVSAICCTHNHEDHAGNCGALAREHGCPVFMSNADKLWGEGVGPMAAYRRLWWGRPAHYRPEEMPEEIRGQGRPLRAIPTPGHSQTHAAFFEKATGLLFVGDLYVAAGVAAVMSHENPYEAVRSLRRVAALDPARMLNGHGLDMERPADRLRQKADRIEEASGRVVEMHDRGMGERRIVLRIFSNGWGRDLFSAVLTGGEFSRLNFVRACIAHRGMQA